MTHEPFPFDKMVSGMLDSEMVEDKAKIVNEAIKEKGQVYLIINNQGGGNAPWSPKGWQIDSFRRSSNGYSDSCFG